MAFLSNALSIALLIIGFGFVIFWHELGHFLAAKWVGIKVEQFAVGMGHALVSFRKGIGVRLGNTRAEYDQRITAHLDLQHKDQVQLHEKMEYTDAQKARAAQELGLGETEYRLSWIPVGGYVKMLGQDDMRPGADAEDPRAFNKKSIPKRMLVVSAGVIMNIILAALLFMALFMMGFHAPAPVIGQVLPGSPAQDAGLVSGDTIIDFDGTLMHDWTKVSLNTALASEDKPMHVRVRHLDGKEEVIDVQPVKPEGASKAFLAMGVLPSQALQGMKANDYPPPPKNPDLEDEDLRVVRPGDVITHVNGAPVSPSALFEPGKPGDYHKFIETVQNSRGKPVQLTIKRNDGKVEKVSLQPHFQQSFLEKKPFNIAGMMPRIRVDYISTAESPVLGKIKPGDIIQSVEVRNSNASTSQPGDRARDVSVAGFIKTVGEAGAKNQTLNIVVLRDGKTIHIDGIKATVKIPGTERKGVGIATGFEDQTPVIAAVMEKSPAANVKEKEGLPQGSLVQAVDHKPVKTWFDVQGALDTRGEHVLTLLLPGEEKSVQRTITLNDEDVKALNQIRLSVGPMLLGEEIVIRKTGNAFTALGWGAQETRDLILQFYVTLQRMFGGSVSPSNLMGPIGIVGAGTKFAFKGYDWLVWFLAMISANLAVVNFLPIPIVDGGLFLFLIIEKIQGKPLSRRAQEYAQLVGLALILSVFLMVTYNDIMRMF
jgi:regulator of sigma E protease